MNFRPPARIRASAFTLIELLTVIAIIAILMGLLFPALQVVRNQADKVQAKTDLMGTIAAVKQYNTEYGKYPSPISAPGADYLFGDMSVGAPTITDTSPTAGTVPAMVSNANLYNILRNYPGMARPATDGNPRQIVFFEGRNATPAGTTGARKGFGYKSSSSQVGKDVGAFYDPWGTEYYILIDGGYDNALKVPYTDFNSNLNVGCAAWSVGKDLKIGTKGDSVFKNATGTASDDIISWQ